MWSRDLHEHDTAMLTVVYSSGFLRSGQFAIQSESSFDPSIHHTLQDMALDNQESPSMLCLHLKQSKIDPFHQGTEIYLGKTDKKLYPVTAVVWYFSLKRNRGGFLVLFKDSSPLTKPVLVQQICKTLIRKGMEGSKYSSHTFHSLHSSKQGLR